MIAPPLACAHDATEVSELPSQAIELVTRRIWVETCKACGMIRYAACEFPIGRECSAELVAFTRDLLRESAWRLA